MRVPGNKRTGSTATAEYLRRQINTLNVSEVLSILHDAKCRDELKACDLLISLTSWLPPMSEEKIKSLSLQSVDIPVTQTDQVVKTLEEKNLDARRDICYAVIDFTRDLSIDYDSWCGEMANALVEAGKRDDFILVDSLMHSGADLFYPLEVGDELMAVWDAIMMNDVSSELTSSLDTLFPGLPQTIKCASLETVRRFLRMWVYPPPLDLCADTSILNELSHHSDTIKLIHAIYANNETKVEEILTKSSSTVDVNARAIDRLKGPTILWYVIEKRQSAIARLLVSHGASVDCTVTIESEDGSVISLPVLYAGLSDATVDVDMMKALLQQSSGNFSPSSQMRFKDTLYRMLINGKNILEQALASSLNLDAFRVLLHSVGAKAIADRNCQGKTIRDIAVSTEGMREYVQSIDDCVISMIQNTESVDRKILALFGYDITNINMQEPPVDDFYSLYGQYQEWIKSICRSIDKNDMESFTNLIEYSGAGNFERLITWEGREGSANPLPMLHRAVIFNRKEMVQAILKLRPVGHSIDTLLDHQRRTALHYAYSKSEFAEIRDILRAHGCSERVKDRNGYEPLDFKHNQDRNCIIRLIGQLRFGEFSSAEPVLARRKLRSDDALTLRRYIDITSRYENGGDDDDNDDSEGNNSSNEAAEDDDNWIDGDDDDDSDFEDQVDACSIM